MLSTDAAGQTSCGGFMTGQVCLVTATSVTMSMHSNVTYEWNNANGAAVTQTIPTSLTCGGSLATNGFTFTVKDETGTAGTYPITVVPAGSDTIDQTDNATKPFVLNANFESITFQCDGAPTSGIPGNWLVE